MADIIRQLKGVPTDDTGDAWFHSTDHIADQDPSYQLAHRYRPLYAIWCLPNREWQRCKLESLRWRYAGYQGKSGVVASIARNLRAHWSDVIIGLLIGYWLRTYVLNLFR